MKSIQFFLIIIVLIFISYLDFNYSLKGFLIISIDLFFITYFAMKKFTPDILVNISFNFNFFYYCLFVVCFYSLYFFCTSFIFINNEALIYDNLNKFELVKALLLYPVFEELIFRKYLLVHLTILKSKRYSIVILSLGFTLIHCMTDSSLLYVFLLSIFLSWIYLKTRNVYLTISLHILNNFLSITNLINYLSKNKTVSIFIVIVLTLLILFAFFKISNDKINEYYDE